MLLFTWHERAAHFSKLYYHTLSQHHILSGANVPVTSQIREDLSVGWKRRVRMRDPSERVRSVMVKPTSLIKKGTYARFEWRFVEDWIRYPGFWGSKYVPRKPSLCPNLSSDAEWICFDKKYIRNEHGVLAWQRIQVIKTKTDGI
jgi:hypothetical protein